MRLRFSEIICIALIFGGLVLALHPNTQGEMNHLLPTGLVKWINSGHDEEENLFAFLILGTFALCSGQHSERDSAHAGSKNVRLLRSRSVRMGALMGLVCAIEFVQTFILGGSRTLLMSAPDGAGSWPRGCSPCWWTSGRKMP